MCQSIKDGGKRCYNHTRNKYSKIQQVIHDPQKMKTILTDGHVNGLNLHEILSNHASTPRGFQEMTNFVEKLETEKTENIELIAAYKTALIAGQYMAEAASETKTIIKSLKPLDLGTKTTFDEVKAKLKKIEEIKQKHSKNPNNKFTIEEIITLMSLNNVQTKAPVIERIVGHTLKWERNSPSSNSGDFTTKQGKTVELKVSFSNKAKTINARQIRLWQNCDYLLMYVNEIEPEESKVWVISHEEMAKLVEENGSSTHGTAQSNMRNKNVEMSLSFKTDSAKIKQFQSNELKKLLINSHWNEPINNL